MEFKGRSSLKRPKSIKMSPYSINTQANLEVANPFKVISIASRVFHRGLLFSKFIGKFSWAINHIFGII